MVDLDAIALPAEEGGEAPALDAADITAAADDGFIGAEAFFAGFTVVHTVGGHLAGLKSLVEAPARPEARPASDAIYEICRETPALHFLIQPGGLWLQRLAVIGAYALPLAVAVKGELVERRAKAKLKPVDKGPAAAAPDAPGADQGIPVL